MISFKWVLFSFLFVRSPINMHKAHKIVTNILPRRTTFGRSASHLIFELIVILFYTHLHILSTIN